MLAVIESARPIVRPEVDTARGSPRADARRRARDPRPAPSRRAARRTRRPTAARRCRPRGSCARIRSATVRRNSSPAAWPNVSLTCLKPSMSTYSAAIGTLRAARSREHLLGAIECEHAVRQPGQRVMERLVLQLSGLLGDHPERRSRERESTSISRNSRTLTSRGPRRTRVRPGGRPTCRGRFARRAPEHASRRRSTSAERLRTMPCGVRYRPGGADPQPCSPGLRW